LPSNFLSRSPCQIAKIRDNNVRLQLHALAYNVATFLPCIELPTAKTDWSLTRLQFNPHSPSNLTILRL